MPIITTEDGDQIEVSFADIELADGEEVKEWTPAQELANRTAGRVRSDYANHIDPSQAADDDELWQQMASARGVDLREDDLMPSGASRGEVKELKKQLAQLKQKAERVEDLESQMQAARDTRLENQLLQHASGVKDDLQDVFLSVAKERFTYDEYDDDFVPLDDDGNPDYVRSTDDVINQLRESRPSLFKDRSASSGPKDEPSPAGSAGKKVWTSDEHAAADPVAMDQDTYNDWMTAAEEGRIK
jgi:hypothetical protein